MASHMMPRIAQKSGTAQPNQPYRSSDPAKSESVLLNTSTYFINTANNKNDDPNDYDRQQYSTNNNASDFTCRSQWEV